MAIKVNGRKYSLRSRATARARAPRTFPRDGEFPPVEVGASLCRGADGKLTTGPVNTGTEYSVDIPVKCPPGTEFEGFIHTHPNGVPYPSHTDVMSAKKFKAKRFCIYVPGTRQLACYRPSQFKGARYR